MTAVFSFQTPNNPSDTMYMLERVIAHMGGKTKRKSPSILKAAWRTGANAPKKVYTVLPTRCVFYVGEGNTRAVVKGLNAMNDPVLYQFKPGGIWRVWDFFIVNLQETYSSFDFGLSAGVVTMESAKIVDDGIEQVFTSYSRSHPSYGGALLGGVLFGATGAILGGMNGRTSTVGVSSSRFSDVVLVRGRYSNGLLVEGKLYKNSPSYHEIMINMNRLDG